MTLTNQIFCRGSNNMHMSGRVNGYDQLDLRSYQCADHNTQDLEKDIDPDKNFLCNIMDNCQYYNQEQYNQTFATRETLSIIHFNSRSLYANFNNIKEYLQAFSQPFSVIAVSETWINTEKGMDFELDG